MSDQEQTQAHEGAAQQATAEQATKSEANHPRPEVVAWWLTIANNPSYLARVLLAAARARVKVVSTTTMAEGVVTVTGLSRNGRRLGQFLEVELTRHGVLPMRFGVVDDDVIEGL